MCFDFSTNFVWSIYISKKHWVRYDVANSHLSLFCDQALKMLPMRIWDTCKQYTTTQDGGSHSSVDEDVHLWDIMLCRQVNASDDTKAPQSCETLGNMHQSTWHNIPKDLNLSFSCTPLQVMWLPCILARVWCSLWVNEWMDKYVEGSGCGLI